MSMLPTDKEIHKATSEALERCLQWNKTLDTYHRQASERAATLENAIRIHRDQRGDDRCWRDDEELYKVLPEGYTPPARDTAVELHNCERFIQMRQHPDTEYVSPEREIELLRAQVDHLTGKITKGVL